MAVTDYRIPDNKLPTFVSFRAQVALEVFGIMGDYSELSSPTSKYVCLSVCLSVLLVFVHFIVYLSICLLSVCPFVFLSVHLSVLYCLFITLALQTTPPMNTVTTPRITVDTQITPCTCDSVSVYVGLIVLLGGVVFILILIILILVLFLCIRNRREPLYNIEKPPQATRYNNRNEKIQLHDYGEHINNKYQFKSRYLNYFK